MNKLMIISILLVLTACTKPSDIKKASKIYGWKNAVATGYCWLNDCGDEGEFYETSFTAKKGNYKFTGCVCSGLFFHGIKVRIN